MSDLTDRHPRGTRIENFADWYERIPNDPPYCVGHLDRTTDDEHNTELDYFGPDGLTVVQTDGHEARVSFADFNLRGPVSTARARLVVTQILEACALADRYPRVPAAAD